MRYVPNAVLTTCSSAIYAYFRFEAVQTQSAMHSQTPTAPDPQVLNCQGRDRFKCTLARAYNFSEKRTQSTE